MPESVRLLVVTGPDRETLVRIGRVLVEEALVACVNVLPGITSVYRWEDEVQVDAECMALFKTTGTRVERVCRRLAELHPYELAECVALDVVGGSAAYLDWVAESVRSAGEDDVEA